MKSTPLSTLINRMDAYQKIATMEAQYKVRHLDSALRDLKRDTQLPWCLKKSTLRVFDRVYEYPVAADHSALAYLDNNNQFAVQSKAHFYFTSLQQFYENQTYRNLIAEIFDNGTRYLGIRYKDFNFGSQQIDSASVASNYSASGTASNPAVDNVFYHSIDGNAANSSISYDVTAGTANFICNFTSYADANFRRKYFFVDMYMPAEPTSIELRFGNDASNYYSSGALTTQFSGKAIKSSDWNLMAFDLNAPDSTTGTVDENNFDYFELVVNGASAGKYYVGQSWVREWDLLDYYYYSDYNVQTNGSLTPDQEYFYDSATETYSTDSSFVCDPQFADTVMYDACILALSDLEDKKGSPSNILNAIMERRNKAWDELVNNYPSMKPLIISKRLNFGTDYGYNGLETLNY